MARPIVRLLSWDACFNVRDVGGYKTRGGDFTRWRSLVRADNLCRLTPSGRAALMAYGVRTVIDLRAPFELRMDPCPFAPPGVESNAVAYLNLPVLDADTAGRAVVTAMEAAPTVEAMYVLILERCREQVGAVIRAMAAAPDGGMLVYCHAGKDRTGLIAALALAIAGVPSGTIAEDYALSDGCLQPLYEAQLRQERDAEKRVAMERQLRSPRNAARPQTMLATLGYLDERHGGVSGYLRWAGVEHEEMERLRARIGG